MKNIYIYLSLLAVIVLGTACNNEWEDEQYEQYVSFKAPIASGSDGVTTIYVRYKDNGKVTYQLPIIGIRKWRKINMNFPKRYIFLPVRA